MKKDVIRHLTADFESHTNKTRNGIEFWFARDLQYLLGYTKWDNFINAIQKAKTACEAAGHEIVYHFADVGKMVMLGSGSQREIGRSKIHSKSRRTLIVLYNPTSRISLCPSTKTSPSSPKNSA